MADLVWLSTRDRRDKDLSVSKRAGHVVAANPVGHARSVGGEARPFPTWCQQSWLSAQARNHVNAAAIPLRDKYDLTTVGGERRLVFVGRIGSQWERVATSGLLHPEVEVVLPAAVGGLYDQLAVFRDRGLVG